MTISVAKLRAFVSRRDFLKTAVRFAGGVLVLGSLGETAIGQDVRDHRNLMPSPTQPVPPGPPSIRPPARAGGTTPLQPAGPIPQGQPAATGAEFFLLLDGIQGDSQEAKHKNWIKLDSFTQKRMPLSMGPTTGGLVPSSGPQGLIVRSTSGKASSRLAESNAKALRHKFAVLEGRRQRGSRTEHLKISLRNVTVFSHKKDASGSSPSLSTDETVLRGESVRIELVERGSDGRLLSIPFLVSQ